MKQIYLFLFSLVSVTLAQAQQFVDNGINYNITSSTVPYTVEVIANSPLYSGSVSIPNNVSYNSNSYSVTKIGNNAFESCYGLTSVTIPNSVTSIGHSAFRSSGLTIITIENSVTSIGDYAFYACTGLTSITIPNLITSIGIGTFTGCSGLTSITIPDSVTSIGGQAFNSCSGLTSVTIGNSVSSIGSNTFANCIGLTSVTIPNSVTSIGIGGFLSCTGLTSVTVEWQNPLSINQIVFDGVNIDSVTLNVPAGTANLYEASPVWTEFNIVGGTVPAPRGCWASISTGGQHTLAIAQDNTLWVWGSQANGQLGNNVTSGNVLNPTQISNDPNWAFVSAGELYSLAIKKDGTLWAWGRNADGQLGDGTTTQRNSPVQIGTATDWVGVYAGYAHSIARKSDNTLWSWGRNTSGQLGINSTAVQQTPIQVGTDTNWQTVSVGRNHTVAIKSNGELWSWGSNIVGQLGLGNNTNQLAPVRVGLDTWKAIEAGDYHIVAIKSNNALYSWGDNFSGQLGLGDTTERNSPVQIGTATDWKAIATGLYNTYAINTTGALWASGDGFKGQIGIGNFDQQNSLVQVGTATDWYSVFAGNEFAVAQKTTGSFYSWGDNQSGQLGNGATLPNTTGQNTPGVMGCAGNILAFDGVDDRVQITNIGTGVLGDNTANESYTVEMKIKLNTVVSNKLFSKNTTTPSNQGFTIETDESGNLFFDQAYGGTFSRTQTSSSLTADTWYRVVATFDYATKTHKLYLNGTLVDSKTETGTPNFSVSDAGLGYSYGTTSGKFDGDFNDLRVWNVARTNVEVGSYTRNNQEVNSGANLVTHFKFNQGIANANNAGLTTLATEVVGGPLGTLQNFTLNGMSSNWTQDVTANETLNNSNFIISDDVLIYPNPSTGIYTIDLNEDAQVEVYDMLGKVVYKREAQEGKSTIDISNYQAGIYLLHVKSENGSVTKKIIKQ